MKKKLLLIGSIPPPYHGVTVQNKRLLDSKLKNEFEIIHLDTTDKRDLNNLGKLDIGNIWLGIKHLFKLFYLIVTSRPDIVYLTVAQNTIAFLRDGLFILISKIFSKTKVIIHFRGGNYFNFYMSSSFFLKKYMNLVYSFCDFGIVLGQNLKNMVSKWFHDKQIFVIPNGTSFVVDISKRKNENNTINIGYIGFLAPEKGTMELVRIFEKLHHHHNNIELILAGDYAYGNQIFKEVFQQYLNQSSCKDHVIFLRSITGEAKTKFFLSTDIFAFPSWIEGHPNAVLEAMSAACPIVATDVGAVSESVIDGYNGFLVPPKSEEKFSDRLEVLIKNKKLRQEMGLKSHRFFKEKFTSEINVKKMIKAFEQI